MIRHQVRKLAHEYRKRGQRGFTLIELLVVISILGILAAIVTMSLVGITNVATQRAAKTEAQTVQTAYDTMLADQNVKSGWECANNGGPQVGDNGSVTVSVVYSSSDQPGAVTGSLDMTGAAGALVTTNAPTIQSGGDGSHLPAPLYPNYIRQAKTHGKYHCTGNGRIIQDSYTP